MITTCTNCGGLFATENFEMFAGTPCRCGRRKSMQINDAGGAGDSAPGPLTEADAQVSLAPSVSPSDAAQLVERAKTHWFGRSSEDDRELAIELVAAIESLQASLREMQMERAARNKIDPVTRLHNIADFMAEGRRDSPYTQEAWDLQQEAYTEKCKELAAAKREAENVRAQTIEECARRLDAIAAQRRGTRYASYEAGSEMQESANEVRALGSKP